MFLFNAAILILLATQVLDLFTLLVDDSFKDVIVDSELTEITYTENEDGQEVPSRELLIPKIIHQTYKNETIPEVWQYPQQTVKKLNPDYEYILWTDQTARDFIEENYNWFLPTFDSYPYPIMRADAIRYFILSHYGGIYIDLDNGCEMNLDPLLTFPAWLRKTKPTGISNDLMGSVPNHPFFTKVIDNLEKYNRNWFVSYITIMYSTGPLFLSVIWKKYKRWGVPDGGTVRILVNPNSKTEPHRTWFFFTEKGSSWHLADAKFIMQMGKHWILMTILGTLLVLGMFYLQYKFYQMLNSGFLTRMYRRLRNRNNGANYAKTDEESSFHYEMVPN